MKTMSSLTFKSYSLLFFIIVGFISLATRWWPHESNFTLMGAFFFLAGLLFASLPQQRFIVVSVAFLTVFISDIALGLYVGMSWVYLGYASIIFIGFAWNKLSAKLTSREGQFLGASLSNLFAALLFFAFSNFGVWLSSGLYELTISGLIHCFIMAIPFFKMTALSQVLFGIILYYVNLRLKVLSESQAHFNHSSIISRRLIK